MGALLGRWCSVEDGGRRGSKQATNQPAYVRDVGIPFFAHGPLFRPPKPTSSIAASRLCDVAPIVDMVVDDEKC